MKNSSHQSRNTASSVAKHVNQKIPSTYKRLDANETAMLELQLEQLSARIYEKIEAPMKARQLLPLITEVDPGAETYAYTQLGSAGQATIITNYGDDIPSVDVDAEKIFHRIVDIGAAWEYSVQDMYRAAYSGVPLDAMRARRQRIAIEREIDTIAGVGKASHGIKGFVNNTDVQTSSSTAGAWSASTPLAMLADLNKLVSDAISALGGENPFDTVLLPTDQFLLASQTPLSPELGLSVIEVFKKNNPFITLVTDWNALNAAGGSGKDRLMVYSRSNESVGLVIPLEFDVQPPQPHNLAFKNFAYARTAGAVIFVPMHCRYLDI